MKRITAAAAILLVAVFFAFGTAVADEMKAIAVITKIELAADGASATVTLKDNKTEAEIVVFVDDELTLDKFKDHRIVTGDEIRLKYEPQDGKNHSTYFRKTAGC